MKTSEFFLGVDVARELARAQRASRRRRRLLRRHAATLRAWRNAVVRDGVFAEDYDGDGTPEPRLVELDRLISGMEQ